MVGPVYLDPVSGHDVVPKDDGRPRDPERVEGNRAMVPDLDLIHRTTGELRPVQTELPRPMRMPHTRR